jgi:methionine-rich copper-binding protein CopC
MRVCVALGLAWSLAAPPSIDDAHAHAVITEDSLAKRPIRAGSASEVLLQFNSGVEVKLSRVSLVSKGDVQQTVPIRAGPKAGQIVVSLPALEAGDYALRCRVFAADGHLTEEIRRFKVGP